MTEEENTRYSLGSILKVPLLISLEKNDTGTIMGAVV
jgi:hypothetical protein